MNVQCKLTQARRSRFLKELLIVLHFCSEGAFQSADQSEARRSKSCPLLGLGAHAQEYIGGLSLASGGTDGGVTYLAGAFLVAIVLLFYCERIIPKIVTSLFYTQFNFREQLEPISIKFRHCRIYLRSVQR